jgi:putative peptide zinc metalloprotease protein
VSAATGPSQLGAKNGDPRSAFRDDLEISEFRDDRGQHRILLRDPNTDTSFVLGQRELLVARCFDGARDAAEISQHLHRHHALNAPVAKLLAFERRLCGLGILRNAPTGRVSSSLRDPSSGISYGPLKRILMLNILRFNPGEAIEIVAHRAPWLLSSAATLCGSVVIALGAALVALHWKEFSTDVRSVYATGFAWIPTHYLVVVGSILFHEWGHALACRAYHVRITEIGVAIYLLLATGWAKPQQAQWSALPSASRLVTIVMGPFASLLFASCSAILWYLVPPSAFPHDHLVISVASATVALVPTLLPFFNGDAYLALTELFKSPRIRQRSFSRLRAAIRGNAEHLSAREVATSALVVLGTLAGWGLTWYLVVSFFVHNVVQHP